MRKGEIILWEMDKLKVILINYADHFNGQTSRNKIALNKTSASGPNKTNTYFVNVDEIPSRQSADRRNDAIKDRYARVDKTMSKLEKMSNYENLEIDDEDIGIAGKDWDTRDRSYERRKFAGALESN